MYTKSVFNDTLIFKYIYLFFCLKAYKRKPVGKELRHPSMIVIELNSVKRIILGTEYQH